MLRQTVAAFFCASCLLIARQSASNNALNEAWRLAGSGQSEQAIHLLQKLVVGSPHNADALLLLGSLLMEKGDRSGSIAQLTAAVRLRPQSAEAQNALGEAYNRFGDAKSARGPFEKAVALQPAFAQAQVNLGLVLLTANELPAAAGHLKRAVLLLKNTADAAYPLYLLAKVYSAQNDTQEAAEQLEKAVLLDPRMPEAWSDLGRARKELLNENGAIAAFEHAVELNPDDAVAQYRLGTAYLDADRLVPSIEHLRQAYRLNPRDQSTLNSLQIALRQAGRNTEADEVKQQLTALIRAKDEASQNDVKAVALNNEGAGLQKSGDLRAALEKYRAALNLNPGNVGIRVNYAVALLRLGQWTPGLNELHEALARDPENATIRAALSDAMRQAPPGTVPKWDDKGSNDGRP